MSEQASAQPSSIWSTDDGAHMVEAQAPELRAELRTVVSQTQAVDLGQRAITAIVVIAALWRGFTFGDGDNGFTDLLLAHVWVLVWVGAVGLLVGRALSARRLVGFMLTGFFFVPVVTKLAHDPLTSWVGADTNWAAAGVVPVLEEFLKALPLLALLIGMRRDPSRSISVLDFGLAGFAVGAGFAIHEDLLWERSLVGGFEGLGGLLAPSFVVDPLLAVGHGGWTALIGLGIGFAVVHRGRGPAWLAAVGATVIAVGDHVAANYRGDTELRAWVLDGRLAVIVLAVGLVGALVSGRIVQAWGNTRDWVFPTVPLSKLVTPAAGFFAAGDYARERSMAHTGAWRRFAPGYEAAAQPHIPILLYDAADQAGVAIDPAAAIGLREPEQGDRRRTNPLVFAAVALVPLAIAGGLWLTGGGDDDGEVATERERTEREPVPDDDPMGLGGSEKEPKPPGAEGTVNDVEIGPLTVIFTDSDGSGESTVIVARDGERQIFRSEDTVIYRDADGGYYCIPVGEGWMCRESPADPWTAAGIISSFVPDESMAYESPDGLIVHEVFEEVIAGRRALCYRQTAGSGSARELLEFCVEPETMIMLSTREESAEGGFGGGDSERVAGEVRAPRSSDFDLPAGLDLHEALER